MISRRAERRRSSRPSIARPGDATLGALLSVIVALTGCASIAGHCDYAAYRRTRLIRQEEPRLRALAFYAKHYPTGTWAEEVQRERDALEPEIWEDYRESVDGLEFYLSVFADGEHANDARQRLMAMTTVTERRSEEEERVDAFEQAARERAREARRLWVTNAVQFWVRTLVQLDGYGGPIGEMATSNDAFSEAFGSEPAPVCTPESCIKHYRAPYAIPVPGGTRIDRALDLYLRIHLEAGNVERIELLLPRKGFSRWFELEERTLVTDEAPEERFAALEWAMQRIEPVLRRAVPDATPIDVIPEPVDPVVLAEDGSPDEEREFVTPQSDSGAHGLTGSEASDGSRESEGSEASDGRAGQSNLGEFEGAAGPDSRGGEGEPETETDPAELQSITELLTEALGAQQPREASEPGAPPIEPGSEPETLVFPFGLRALRRGNVRIVVFAASDQDYSEAYDGIYIERIR